MDLLAPAVASVVGAIEGLAAQIEAEHQAAYGAARTAVEHAAECGRLLIKAKSQVAHGEWLPWLAAHTSVSARQSQKYMRLANGWAAIEGKNEPSSHLTLTEAVALLSEPKEEPEEAAPVPIDEYLNRRRPVEPGEIEIPVDVVLFRRELYPRSAIRSDIISRYAEFLPDLPPIEINQRHELIDGLLRLEAHKKASARTIRAVVTQTVDDLEHRKMAFYRNSRHGEQLPIEIEREARQQNGPTWPTQRPARY